MYVGDLQGHRMCACVCTLLSVGFYGLHAHTETRLLPAGTSLVRKKPKIPAPTRDTPVEGLIYFIGVYVWYIILGRGPVRRLPTSPVHAHVYILIRFYVNRVFYSSTENGQKPPTGQPAHKQRTPLLFWLIIIRHDDRIFLLY